MRLSISNILLLISVLSASGQHGTIEGKVISEEGIGIPYSTVGIVGKNFGAVAFEDGSFSLQMDESYLNDTIVFSALGFERKKMAYRDFVNAGHQQIQLAEKISILDEIVITPSKVKYKTMGGSRLKFLYSDPFYLAPRNGSTIAVLFDKIKEPLWIKGIEVQAGGKNLDSFLMRCRIFSVDANLFPGKEILNTDLLQTMEEDGLVKFELENELFVSGPVYVGFEWVMSKEHYEEVERVNEQYPLKFIDELTAEYPGLRTIISNNKRLLLYDSLGRLKTNIKLSEAQKNILKEREEIRPVVYYKCSPAGLRTVYGSYITGKWSKYMLHADVSLTVGIVRED